MDDKLALDAMDFELNPNNSETFYIPEPDAEVEQEISEEKAEVQTAHKYIDTIIEWFGEEIKLTDSIDGLQLESDIDIKAQILARQILKLKLTDARQRIIDQRDTYLS